MRFTERTVHDGAMPEPKIMVPSQPPEVIARPHVEDMLLRAGERGGDQLVTLVCAPAGFGKTSLVSTWALGRERVSQHVAWFNLDESDDDPVTFCAGVLAAVSRALPDTWEDRLPLQNRGENAFVAQLADIVDRQRERVWLVLDDLHRLRHPGVLHALEMVLRWMPRNLRVVLCARRYPALKLHRLRIAGLLREIRAADLAFTEAEVAELVVRHGVRLDEPELARLVSMTGGWPAAVRLAALALAASADPKSTLDTLVSTDRAVDDFLSGEVLAGMPAEQQHLLQCGCVAETFTPELAVELTRRADAPQVLAELERTDPLVCRCDDNEDDYCEHPFLRAYLCAQLRQHSPARLAGLHRLASAWFARRGDIVAAARHAVHSGDGDLAVRQLADLGPGLLLHGETALVLELGAIVPSDAKARLEADLVLALAELMAGERTAADLRMAGLAEDLKNNHRPRVRDLELIVRARRAGVTGRPGSEIDELGARLGRMSDTELLVLALVSRGVALVWFGRVETATRDLEQAMRLATTHGFDFTVLYCLGCLGGIAAVRGDFLQMGDIAEEAIAFAEERDVELRVARCLALTVAAMACYMSLELDRAAELVARAGGLVGPGVSSSVAMTLHSLREMIEFEHGPDPLAAVVRLRALWTKLRQDEPIHPTLVAYETTNEQRMALRLGQVEWALDVERRAALRLSDSGEVHLLQARMHAHQGRISAARHVLEGITSGRVRAQVLSTVVEAHLLAAILAERVGDWRSPVKDVLAAIELAAPRRVLRPFYDIGADIRRLLAAQAGRLGRFDDFVTQLLNVIPAGGPGIGAELTPREMEVLRQLPSLSTLEEIAASLYVSVNTVKTHVRNVYRKFGVTSRREAVVAARRRGLI